MTALVVANPTGATEIKWVHAPRLPDLAGKTVAFLSNDSWQAHRMLPLVQELLKGQEASLQILHHAEFPQGNQQIDRDSTIEQVLARGAQAAILGNAA